MKHTIRYWCLMQGLDGLSTSMLCHFARRVGIVDDTRIEKCVFEALLVVFTDRIVERA